AGCATCVGRGGGKGAGTEEAGHAGAGVLARSPPVGQPPPHPFVLAPFSPCATGWRNKAWKRPAAHTLLVGGYRASGGAGMPRDSGRQPGRTAMNAGWMFLRTELRKRWRSWLALALIVGAFAGAVEAAAAGARRTD